MLIDNFTTRGKKWVHHGEPDQEGFPHFRLDTGVKIC